MHIDVIDKLEALMPLKENWEAVYAADPDCQFFLSWTWLSNWFKSFQSENRQWFILGAKTRPDAPSYVAFFPLQLRTEMKKDGTFYNEIKMGGADFADYAGFLCLPEHEDAAIPAFADCVKRLNWARLHLRSVYASKRRMRLFTKAFSQSKFASREIERIIASSRVDCSIFPYATLPSDFETYLNKQVSTNTRQKAKRFLKRLDQSDELRITLANQKTIGRDLNVLLHFWKLKWGREKGNRLDPIISTNRTMLTHCLHAGALFMPVLWKGTRPLGALGTLIDRDKKALLFLIAGRDETFNSPPPGFLLHAYSIRWAIENGFTTYDFLQGNERYKYMFGVQERIIKTVLVSTKTGRNLGGVLDSRCLSYVLERASEMHKKGKLAEAERAYRQALEAEPQNPLALYLLGQLMAAKHKHSDAEMYFKALLAVRPGMHKAWLKLGKSLEAQGDKDGAIESYRRALALDPGNRDVRQLLLELSPLQDRIRRVASATTHAAHQ
jgi:hypothetical protein